LTPKQVGFARWRQSPSRLLKSRSRDNPKRVDRWGRFDVRFAQKATELLQGSEMTRWADAVEKALDEGCKH